MSDKPRTVQEEVDYWRAATDLEDFLRRTHDVLSWVEEMQDDIKAGLEYEEHQVVFDLLLAAYLDLRDKLRAGAGVPAIERKKAHPEGRA